MTDAMFRILLVEDDTAIRQLLRTLLEAAGYRVVEAETARRAAIDVRNQKADCLIVDLGLPDGDGRTVIRDVRAFSTVPIIVLSARTQDEDKIAALDLGADDYVTKPFNAGELLARVRAALRRSAATSEQSAVLRFGAIEVDLGRRQARGPNGLEHFTPVEFRVLACLARSRDLVVTQEQLIREVWGPDRLGDTRGLRAFVKMLRRKIEPDPARPRHLLTEPGVGYRLVPDDAAASDRSLL